MQKNLISGSTNFVIADTLISKLPCTPIVPPTLRRSLSKSKLVTLISLRLLTVPNSLNLLAPDNEPLQDILHHFRKNNRSK